MDCEHASNLISARIDGEIPPADQAALSQLPGELAEHRGGRNILAGLSRRFGRGQPAFDECLLRLTELDVAPHSFLDEAG